MRVTLNEKDMTQTPTLRYQANMAHMILAVALKQKSLKRFKGSPFPSTDEGDAGRLRVRHHEQLTLKPSTQRALPTETTFESGTSQSKSGTSVNLSNSGVPMRVTLDGVEYDMILRFVSSLLLPSLELSDTQSLSALNTSPPRNRFTFLRWYR